MTPPQDKTEGVSTATIDPWDWTVDEVVATLCGRTHPLLASLDPRSLPDPAPLEIALRENGVSGPTLLLELDHVSLRNDLGIKTLGPRGTILQLITKLRRESPKYFNHVYEEAVDTPLPGYGRISSVGQDTRLGPPYHGSPFHYAPQAMSTASGTFRSPVMLPGRFEHPLQPHFPIEDVSTHNMEHPFVQRSSLMEQVPPLPRPDHEISRHGNTVESSHAPDATVSHATLSDLPKAATDPGIIGFDAKEEMNLEDHNIMDYPTDTFGTTDRAGETYVLDESGRKRRRLVLNPAESAETLGNDDQTPSCTIQIDTASPPREIIQDTSPGTTACTCIEEEVSEQQGLGELQILNVAEAPVANGNEDPQPSLQACNNSPTILEVMGEPGSLIIDSQGRKRMRPILISQPEYGSPIDVEPRDSNDVQVNPTSDSNRGNSPNQVRKAAKRKPGNVYLGLESFPVDKIFYGDVAFGNKLETEVYHHENMHLDTENESDNVVFYADNQESKGLCRYANSRIKHFLRSRPIEIFEQNRMDSIGIIPYPSRIARSHQPLSMTLFSTSRGEITALRVDRSKWLKNNPPRSISHANLDGDPTNHASAMTGLLLERMEDNDDEWGYLEKWKYTDGDKILPAYGDSGSEGEYDMDTWLEMEKESGKIERPLGNRRRPLLDEQTVEETMGEVLRQIGEDWHLKQKPKLQQKAWRLWIKSRRDNNKQEQIENFASAIEKLDDRSIKLRQEIAREEWSAVKDLTKQCKIMEPSVFDSELLKWKLSVLKLKSAPEKSSDPVKKSKVSHRPRIEVPLEEGEENVASDMSNRDSSDEDLDDFVVADDVDDNPVIDDEITMAEIEDEWASDKLLTGDEIKPVPRVAPNSIPVSDPQTPPNPIKKLIVMTPSKKNRTPYADIIDLTQHSDSEEPESPLPKSERSTAVRTPPLYPSDDDPFIRSRRKKPLFKMPPVPDSIIHLGSEPDYSTAGEDDMKSMDLPGLQDINSIKKLNPRLLVERGDRKRLLLWHISKTRALERDLAFLHLENVDQTVLETSIILGLRTMKGRGHRIRGWDNEDSDAIMRIAAWLVCWTIPVVLEQNPGLKEPDIDTVLADKECFHPFYEFLVTCPALYVEGTVPEVISLEPDSFTPVKKKKQKLLLEGPDGDLQDTPRKKRKFMLPESQAALDLRAGAQQRVRDRDNRQKQLKRRFRGMGANNDPSKVVVNTGKFDHQEFIHLNPLIGDRIQSHQIEGVQFMWREITADPDDLQGCLLAQTMGLGKTMQVITLLVTIAEAAKSSNENLRNQVPPKLRASQTLILCPPALIENWWEEFLMWTPMPTSKNVGEIRKVTTTLKHKERLWEIQAWMDEGGVLLMGFNTFRTYIENKAKKSGGNPLDEEQHAMVQEALLRKSAIVVADEAHALKNAGSGINGAMSRIETKSRVALTGSPLMNNLGEYYSLIDWIAPNYLGTRAEFGANFQEQIECGFYQNSTHTQYRHAMKKLEALKTDLEPKTHRADISVLKGRLKEKQEFVIRVPLTELQEQIYKIYVDSMLSANEDVTISRLWAWLATLGLLCNHPKCFRDRLLAKEEAGKKATILVEKEEERHRLGASERKSDLSEEDPAFLDEPVSAFGITRNMIEKQLKPFDTLAEPLDSITLAYKMQILTEILEFSREAQDKVLVFSHSIATLDFVQNFLKKSGRIFSRIDGKTKTSDRQQVTKAFNTGTVEIFLISTRAGGQGLNMFGANRVVILDCHFNPMYEEQAVGRAYRLGQTKPVYVYYLTAVGTFEEAIQNQSLFKQHLAKRVVDDKKPVPLATKGVRQYLYPPKIVEQQNLYGFYEKDPLVLARILDKHEGNPIIRSMDLTETFHQEDDMKLTDEEKKEAEQMQKDEQLRRRNPAAYDALRAARKEEELRSWRKSVAQAAQSDPIPAIRLFGTQGPLTNPSHGVNSYASRQDVFSAATSVAVGSAVSQQSGTMSAPPTKTYLDPQSDISGQGSTRMARPSISVPPGEPQTPEFHQQRGPSEPSENTPGLIEDSSMASPGLVSADKSSSESRMNSRPSPNQTPKLRISVDDIIERPQADTSQEIGVITPRQTGVNSLPPQPANTEGTHTNGETDGKAYVGTTTVDGIGGDKEQISIHGSAQLLKRKRKEDPISSNASPGPVQVMFNKLLRREAIQKPDDDL